MKQRVGPMEHSQFDVCVVGGGPAGLAASIALARTGRSIVVVDHSLPPIDKACGEGLMPDSLAALQELGITIPYDAGYRFRGICFRDATCSVAAEFPTGTGLGLRRTVLHSMLVQRAEEAGVKLLWGIHAAISADGNVAVNGQELRSEWVVAADGQNSRTRNTVRLDAAVQQTKRYGFRRHYRVSPWSSYVEIHWGHHCQVYVTPVAPDEVGIALISRDPHLRLDQAIHGFPEIEGRLRGVPHASREMGSLSVSRKLANVHTRRLALMGDASGSVDAVTGEGLGLSFRQALALAHAIDSKQLSHYEAAHRDVFRRVRAMSRLLLMLDRHPGLQRRVLDGLSQHPAVFSSLLAFHVGQKDIGDLLGWDLLSFCRAFLAG